MKSNHKKSHKAAILTGLLLALPLSLYAPQSYAKISDVPLYVAQSVPPNIMFTIDDSGSMQFEVMPATFVSDDGAIDYMYPDVPSNIYNSSTYSNNVATFKDDPVNSYLRSSHNNKIYYNPEVTYLPWSKKRGELWDDADPTAAYWNPSNTSAGSYNLLIEHTECEDWVSSDDSHLDDGDIVIEEQDENSDSNCTSHVETFWPIVYWVYKGGNLSVYETTSYNRIEIRSATGTAADAKLYIDGVATTMTDLDTKVGIDLGRTIGEELQNFANWFQYYRSRALLAKAGIGRAFSRQGDNMRVGFATINALNDGHGVTLGVRKFTDTFTDAEPSTGVVDPVTGEVDPVGNGSDDDTSDNYRTKFFDTLYNLQIPQEGTPLRRAMAEVGSYFMNKDSDGPWSATPGTTDDQPQLACRQSYNVFMTDGYWSSNSGDPDGSASGVDIDNEDGTDGSEITGPDGRSYTYQEKPPFADDYSETLADVAMYFWANDLRPDLKNRVPTSPVDPAFWQHMVSFTVGLGVFGKYTKDDLDELKAGTLKWPDPVDGVEDSDRIDDLFHAGINGHGDFFSASNPTEFAEALSDTLSDIASRVSSAAAVATNSTRLDAGAQIYQARYNSGDWSGQLLAFNLIATGADAGKVGSVAWEAGDVLNAEVAGNITSTRNIITLHSDGTTVDFLYENLSPAQQTLLNQDADETTDGKGLQRVKWLRGSHNYEVGSGTTGASFRARSNVLGDIVNSNPHFMGQFDYRYFSLPGNTGLEGSSYAIFRDSDAYTTRPEVLFIGANDGMLHAFDTETGKEIFAYIPSVLYDKLPELTDPDYSHQFYVDGSPRSGDAYFNSNWHTVLVGGLGAGGKAIYALDVTHPDDTNNPDILWEFTPADTDETLAEEDLGYTFSEPTIVRLYDGKWYVAFGNGYGSASGDAALYLLDIETGAVTYKFEVDAGPDNGLSTPIPIDLNGDRITDYIYAGDLQGNMWRFDVHNNAGNGNLNTGKWGATKLFQAVDQDSLPQPITHRPEVGLHPEGGVMVYFGTGQYYETGDNEVDADPQIQTFYGIRDTLTDTTTVSRSNLVKQEILFEGPIGNLNIRVLSSNEVDYSTKDGWYLDLVYPNDDSTPVGKGERVVSRPLLRDGRIIFTTLIPSSDACLFGGTSWIMEMDPINGGSLSYTVFDVDGDGDFDADDFVDTDGDGVVDVPVSGVQSTVGIVNTPGIISAGDTEYKYLSGSSGEIERVAEKSDADPARTSWRELLKR